MALGFPGQMKEIASPSERWEQRPATASSGASCWRIPGLHLSFKVQEIFVKEQDPKGKSHIKGSLWGEFQYAGQKGGGRESMKGRRVNAHVSHHRTRALSPGWNPETCWLPQATRKITFKSFQFDENVFFFPFFFKTSRERDNILSVNYSLIW